MSEQLVSSGDAARQGVVHAFAVSREFQETLAHIGRNLPSISQSVSQPLPEDLLPSIVNRCVMAPRIHPPLGVNLSQRNTPALFGADLIDAVPQIKKTRKPAISHSKTSNT